MTAINQRYEGTRRRNALIHAGAKSVAFVSGTFALVALFVGSPQQFGLALAVCGAGWMVTSFIEQERAHRRRPAPSALATRRFVAHR